MLPSSRAFKAHRRNTYCTDNENTMRKRYIICAGVFTRKIPLKLPIATEIKTKTPERIEEFDSINLTFFAMEAYGCYSKRRFSFASAIRVKPCQCNVSEDNRMRIISKITVTWPVRRTSEFVLLPQSGTDVHILLLCMFVVNCLWLTDNVAQQCSVSPKNRIFKTNGSRK